MGVYAHICIAGQGAVASYGYVYNSYATSGIGIAASTSYASGNNYYAYADINLYNGSTYNHYTTYNTPYVQTMNGSEEVLSDVVAAFGPSLMTVNGKKDTVIPATGINGRSGYITYTDLDMYYVPSSPGEAVAYTASQPDVRYIPVYDKDGVNVVDSYPVYGGYNGDIIVIL